ncbi:MAG: class I SAM-dependent methyltransferase [Crocinitomicaceae bacterium]|nr:class I SAM-dependent methyltransferase [Crocinitomicaceae bacterium]
MKDYYETRFKFDKDRTKVWRALCEYLQQFTTKNGAILEFGSGYCDFINNIEADKKYAVDIMADSQEYCKQEVQFFCEDICNKLPIEDRSIDMVFASNLFEHLNDEQLNAALTLIKVYLKKGGKLALVQPNYKYCYKHYFDDYTHVKVFSHISLTDFLESQGFTIERSEPKFIPFSMKSRLPKSYFLTKMYLKSPFRPSAKQMLVVARYDA